MALKRICGYPGCNNLCDYNKRYCKEHSHLEIESYNQAISLYKQDSNRWYNTSKWKALREKHLKEEPFCVICGKEEDLTVDHIKPFGNDIDLFLDPNNLQTLCKDCHNKKTMKDMQERRKEDFRKREMFKRYKKVW